MACAPLSVLSFGGIGGQRPDYWHVVSQLGLDESGGWLMTVEIAGKTVEQASRGRLTGGLRLYRDTNSDDAVLNAASPIIRIVQEA
ncbi:hypothetical protein DSM25558_0615 [Agrobacterium sp. DSM 25558]|nr:hypothetical protein DSM25558_0615 [Agrobacterium sp. DSM 25558]